MIRKTRQLGLAILHIPALQGVYRQSYITLRRVGTIVDGFDNLILGVAICYSVNGGIGWAKVWVCYHTPGALLTVRAGRPHEEY